MLWRARRYPKRPHLTRPHLPPHPNEAVNPTKRTPRAPLPSATADVGLPNPLSSTLPLTDMNTLPRRLSLPALLLAVLVASPITLLGCDATDSGASSSTLAVDEAPSITYGELDGEDHPGVLLLLMEVNGSPAWRCSGTLLSPTVVLTAGHCTHGATGGRAFTESDVEAGLGVTNSYPFAGQNAVEFAALFTHPDYDNDAFYLRDVGIVTLSEAVVLPDGSDYGVLPGQDALDALRPGAHTTFTAVGYGHQRINPVFSESLRTRMRAEPRLVQINVPGFTGSHSLLLSNNASTGGTCFGDSGGPNFLGASNVVAGVTSFGINGNCAGTGGVFRMDRADVLAFVSAYL